MKINIFFLKSGVEFTKEYKKRLETVIRDSARRAAGILGLKKNVINFKI